MANYDSTHTGAVIDAAVTKATPTTLGTSEVSKCVTVDASGDLIVPDSDKFKFGAGSDMQLYHDGSNSFIQQSGTGALKVATEDSGKAVSIGHTTSETTVNDNLTVTGDLAVTGSLPTAAQGWVKISQVVNTGATATMDLEFATALTSAYDQFMVTLVGLTTEDDNKNHQMAMKVGGSYRTGADDYSTYLHRADNNAIAYAVEGDEAEAIIQISFDAGNAAGDTFDAIMYFQAPSSTTTSKKIWWHGTCDQEATQRLITLWGNARYHGETSGSPLAALTGLRFSIEGDTNIDGGTITLYGLAN